ncbi:MAG: DUF5683 domain-containing protein [Prevotella sp.]|jgi:hypothetical protein|nr:DUF5683 domain-containing protein [Prevotella sp.]
MSRGLILIILCILSGGITCSIRAQEPLSGDTIKADNQQLQAIEKRVNSDTIMPLIDGKKLVLSDTLLLPKPEFKPNSTKAVIYSAIFPGLGQAYNRKYWKLPIIYGGALGLVYAITWNGRVYNDYNNAYRDLVLNVQGGSYINFLPPGMTSPDDWSGGRDAFQDALKRKKDFFRRNRDLAIIVSVGVYALCMIDAYVDAQLYDFDVSPDLSLMITPVVWGPSPHSKVGFGIQCNIIF